MEKVAVALQKMGDPLLKNVRHNKKNRRGGLIDVYNTHANSPAQL